MKIAILSDGLPPHNSGGAEIVAESCAHEFTRLGHRVTIVTTTQKHEVAGERMEDDVRVIRLYAPAYHPRWRAFLSVWNPLTTRRLKSILSAFGPDVVLAQNIHYHLSYHSLKIAKSLGATVMLTAHDYMLYSYGKISSESRASWVEQWRENRFRYNPFRNLLIWHYMRSVDRIIAVSHALQRALNNNGIQNVSVIYNGVNLDDWKVTPDVIERFRRAHGLEGKRIIFFGGRLSRAKGGDHLLRAITKVVAEIPEAVVLIAGQRDSYTEEMLESARKNGIGKHLIFVGWLDSGQMAAAYHTCDVVVFPSVYPDPFGMVNIEAMACGKPVIATSLGGAPEIVQDGVTGYVVDPHDEVLLADRITRLLADPEAAKRMGAAGYERVGAHFTVQRQANEYLAAFKAVARTGTWPA